MKLYPLAYSAALLPLFTVHLCYLLAASYGHVAWCLPHIESCASISQSGRYPPEFFVFKALMIPSAVLMLFYWFACQRWLAALTGQPLRRVSALPVLAVIAAAGLVLYSVMLGAIGDGYQTLRRIGVTTFFGLSYIAQLLVSLRLLAWSRQRPLFRGLSSSLIVLSVAVLVIGIATVIIDAIDPDYYDTKVDAFEWTVTVLLCLHVVVTARFWQRTGFATTAMINVKEETF